MDDLCPCGSGREYADCCGPLLAGTRPAATAEALMRSRYSAFVKNDAAYLERTLLPRRRSSFDAREMLAWNADVVWTGLRILATEGGGARDGEGVVDFVAACVKAGETREIREVSRFRRKNGLWYYVDGKAEDAVPRAQAATEAPAPKVGRNAPCPCGSGKKFKHCCGG